MPSDWNDWVLQTFDHFARLSRIFTSATIARDLTEGSSGSNKTNSPSVKLSVCLGLRVMRLYTRDDRVLFQEVCVMQYNTEGK